jgi:hypothetical protein
MLTLMDCLTASISLCPAPLPPPSPALPQVHLKVPNLARVCRKLGIDYAPALTGFGIRGGRSVPNIEGVVVCSEHGQLVLDAHLAAERWVGGWGRGWGRGWVGTALDAVGI